MSTGASIGARIEAAERAGDLAARTIDELTDEQARGASRLPGWTRGHVVTHLARNADALRDLVEGAIVGEEREQYPGGAEGRAGAIDDGADRDAAGSPRRLRARRAGVAAGEPHDRDLARRPVVTGAARDEFATSSRS